MKRFIFSLCIAAALSACSNDKKEDQTEKKDMAMSSTETKQEKNKKIVMAGMENFVKGDFDAVLKDVAPAFVDYMDGTGAPVRDKDSLKNILQMVHASFENYKPENIMYLADGDYVVVIANWSGVFKKDLMGMKATGKPFTIKDADIFKLDDNGKITEHSSVQQLGPALVASGMNK